MDADLGALDDPPQSGPEPEVVFMFSVPQLNPWSEVDLLLGQLPHGLTDPPRAAQKALPNGSSAHARQLDGSPVQLGVVDRAGRRGRCPTDCGGNTGKIGVCAFCSDERRRGRGTGGEYAGRFSRIEELVDGRETGAVAGGICGVELMLILPLDSILTSGGECELTWAVDVVLLGIEGVEPGTSPCTAIRAATC